MDAIILAAGRGSRLGELTVNLPKPLTLLAGKPLLEWQLSALHHAKIQTVHIVTGYNASTLAEYGDYRIYNPFWSHSNMVRSLLQADEILSQEPVLVCYGDIVYQPEIILKLMACNADVAISFDREWLKLWSERFNDPFSDAESFECDNGLLKSIGKRVRDVEKIQGQYMGLLKFTPIGWSNVKNYLNTLSTTDVNKLDMTTLLSNLLEKGIDITTIAIDGGWVEVDNPEDITLYESKIKANNWLHDWRW
ncbi:Glucose-1-phosphate cytidylyltransferase [Shewanella putrefaciens]|nr:Glucose-1-phosphate cytidylyltransferase [Shewanella putrefaciens]